MAKQTKITNETKKYNLQSSDVPPQFREPHITSGYRQDQLSTWECIQSLFHRTNETLNVWTHVLALVFFLLYCSPVFLAGNAFQDSFIYPLLSFAIGISSVYIMSIGAHTFNCMSIKAHKICYFFDYAAISFYTFTAGMAFYSYSRPLHIGWAIFNNRAAFVSVSALISFISTSVACHAHSHQWRHKSTIRTFFYASAWLYNTAPYTACILLSDKGCNVFSRYDFQRHCLLMIAGAFAYVSHLPERLMIGVFDFFGHSHQFLHVLCAMANSDGFSAVQKDLVTRRMALDQFPPPTFANTLGLTLFVMVGNVAIVLWFTKKLYTITDKRDD